MAKTESVRPNRPDRKVLFRVVSYGVKRSLHKRSLIKLFTQDKLFTTVFFAETFGHLCHSIIKTSRYSIHYLRGAQPFVVAGRITFIYMKTAANEFELCL